MWDLTTTLGKLPKVIMEKIPASKTTKLSNGKFGSFEAVIFKHTTSIIYSFSLYV